MPHFLPSRRQLTLLFCAVVSSAYLCSAQENYSLWLHSKDVVINTGASGYNVSGDVYRFPYLVRLTSKDFTFSEALVNGRDIRFAKANGAHLSYQVEWWDTLLKKAAVWVRVDTILGNNSTQKIVMYWGNSAAADSSKGSTVFDTASGFAAVWHLAEEGNATAGDATLNHLNGAPTGMTTASDTLGVIGLCRNFNNSGYLAITGSETGVLNLAEGGPYTMSAWTYVSALPSVHSPVFSKGDHQYQLKILSTGSWEFVEYGSAGVGWQQVSAPAAAGAWCYVVGQRTSTMEYLWINGECVDSSITTYANTAARNTSFAMHIGHCPEYTAWYFPGLIDEPVISTVKRSAAWLKLSCENQKFIPEPPKISYAVKSYRIRLDSIVNIAPVITGTFDSLTISPAPANLPLLISFNSSTGEIMAWPMEVFTDTFYVRAYNVSGYSEDTLYFTTFDPSAAAFRTTAGSRVSQPQLLGLAGGNRKVAFVMPQTALVSSVGFSLFSCRGVRVWSKQVAVCALYRGVNFVPLPGAIAAGAYFCEMTTLLTGSSAPLCQRMAVTLMP